MMVAMCHKGDRPPRYVSAFGLSPSQRLWAFGAQYMFMKFSTLLFMILVTIAVVMMGGCIGQDAALSAEEQAQVRTYSDPIADNLLLALN